jgi:hypothetical protein
MQTQIQRNGIEQGFSTEVPRNPRFPRGSVRDRDGKKNIVFACEEAVTIDYMTASVDQPFSIFLPWRIP